MNLGSHRLAFLNEQAVEHADVSMTLPQNALQPEPEVWLHAALAEVSQEDSHFSTHAKTGSSGGLFSGITITSGSSGGGKTFSGIHCGSGSGTGSGSEGAGEDLTTTCLGPSST